jgi:flagellar hook capping protein FlgD
VFQKNKPFNKNWNREVRMRKYFILCLILFTNILLAFDPPENVLVYWETGLVTWSPPAQIICEDDFDEYINGDHLTVVSPDLWSTWNNLPGSEEDVMVTNAFAASPSNSILVEENSNILLNMEDYTNGVYSVDIDMYVPVGYSGYYNIQKTSTPGEELGFQIYLQTDGTAVADAGGASAVAFDYYQDEWMDLRLVIDLNNDWCDFYFNGCMMIGFQWTLGASGIPGLLQLGGLDLKAEANPTTNDIPIFYVDNMQFKEVLYNTDPDLIGYNVYLDNILQGVTTELEYQLTGLVQGEEYFAGVSAVYDNPPGESDIVEATPIWPPPPVLPPYNLELEIQDYNSVLLEWDLPGGSYEEISHHSGYDNNGIGTNGEVDFICCARFNGDELADYYYGGWGIVGVNIILHSLDFDYLAIQIYSGGSTGNPGTLVYNEDITNTAVAMDWTYHTLTTPVPIIGGNEYWIGYEIHATDDHPAAVDDGPMVPNKGAWMYFDGVWQTLPELGATLDFNWIITGIVDQIDESISNSTPQEIVLNNKTKEPRFSKSSFSLFEAEFIGSTKKAAKYQDNSRELAGYKVYRDEVEIAEISDPEVLTYLNDEGLNAGTYEYFVTALYENPTDESGPSNIEEVEIELPAPTGFDAVSNWPNILFTWTAMPGVQSYNMYIDDELLINTTSTFYLYPYPTEMHCINLAAVFNGGWVGDWSYDLWIGPNPGTDPNLLPLITSLAGNYPNPFNPATMIKFGLHEDQFVKIDIYNLKGQKIKQLINEQLPAGQHSVVWKGTDDSGKAVSSGVYLYKMHSGNYTKTRKMILLK